MNNLKTLIFAFLISSMIGLPAFADGVEGQKKSTSLRSVFSMSTWMEWVNQLELELPVQSWMLKPLDISIRQEEELQVEPWMFDLLIASEPIGTIDPALALESWMTNPDYLLGSSPDAPITIEAWMKDETYLEIGQAESELHIEDWMLQMDYLEVVLPESIEDPELQIENWMLD